MAKKSKSQSNGALVVQSKTTLALLEKKNKLKELKAQLAQGVKSANSKGHGEQNRWLKEHGDFKAVQHTHVERLGQLMSELAVIARRGGQGHYGDSPGKRIDKVVKSLGAALGELTAAAAENYALELFPDRYDRHETPPELEDLETEIDGLEDEIRELKSDLEDERDEARAKDAVPA